MAPARESRALIVALAVFALALWTAAPASAVEPPSYLFSFGPSGPQSSEEFDRTGPVAVDQQTHAVYVIDHAGDALYKFDTEGEPLAFGGSEPYIEANKISELDLPPANAESQVAVDSASHRVYVTVANAVRAFEADGEAAEFSAGPGAGTSEIGGFTKLNGIAVDANGAIYASDYGPEGKGEITVFAASGEELSSFETANPANLAVDDKGAVYVNRFRSTVLKFTSSSGLPATGATTYTPGAEPFTGVQSYSVAVNPATNDVYVPTFLEFGGPKVYWYGEEGGEPLATFAGPGEEGEFFVSEGLAFDVASERLFVARIEGDDTATVGVFGPKPPCEEPPQVLQSSAGEVAARSAVLFAQINPCSSPTTYRFEYGPSACPSPLCTEIPLGGEEIGAGHTPEALSQTLSGLLPATTYHYRVVAENSFGQTTGPDRTLTTQGAEVGFRLSDSRVWELVSPANKLGGSILASGFGVVQAAAGGGAVAYQSRGSVEADPEGNRAFELSSVLSKRGAGGLWSSKDLTPPHSEPTKLEVVPEFKMFSSDLSSALLEPRDDTPLSPLASERTPYRRQNTEPPSYQALVNPTNVAPGSHWGAPTNIGEYVTVAGANASLSQVALRSREPLVEGAAEQAIYLWSGGELEAASELPGGEGGEVRGGVLGSGASSVRHAISAEGSRAFWQPGDLSGLYLRNTEAEETTRLDLVKSGGGGGEAKPVFQAASADGSVVFFTDTRRLVLKASASGADLYRCEIGDLGGGSLGCTTLTDITAPLLGGDDSKVRGVVAAVSEKADRAYFVAEGVLDKTANEHGDKATPEEPNLYLWEEGVGVRFIATLAEEDSADWGETNGVAEAGKLTSAASPDGRHFAFMSQLGLSGRENLNPKNGEPVEQVFSYDAATEELQCLSCKPTGAAPRGVEMPTAVSDTPPLGVDRASLWSSRWVAATVPESMRRSVAGPTFYQPRAVLDSGRIYFNAVDPLVAADSNGEWDVYQYQPLGVGDCQAAPKNAAVARSGSGCVALVSSGSSEGESAFIDASADGKDVFFTTRGRLSALDIDVETDVYDARVGGIEQKLTPKIACAGENCQPLASAPNDPTPASEAFQGPGNVEQKKTRRCPKAKRKVKRKGKVRCAKKHHKRHTKHKRRGRSSR